MYVPVLSLPTGTPLHDNLKPRCDEVQASSHGHWRGQLMAPSCDVVWAAPDLRPCRQTRQFYIKAATPARDYRRISRPFSSPTYSVPAMVLGSSRLIGKDATNTTTAASSTAASKSTIIFEFGGARYIAINAFAVRKASCFILCLPGTGTNLHPLVRAQP